MGGTNRTWNGLLFTGIGDPPERSVSWGRGRRQDHWRPDPDDAGHWVPKPPYPKTSDGVFADALSPDNAVVDRVATVVDLARNHGYRVGDLARHYGITDRAMRSRLAQYRERLTRYVPRIHDPDEQRILLELLAALRDISRHGRPSAFAEQNRKAQRSRAEETGSESVVGGEAKPRPNRKPDV